MTQESTSNSSDDVVQIATLIIFLIWLVTLGTPVLTYADYGNYSSVLLGDRASGMGGAFTAMTGDPSACSFYNPATLVLMQGSTFSASSNLYTKYDTSFGDAGNFSASALKLNQGSFQAIPSSAGSAIGFGTFAVGFSILTPDHDLYSGDINIPSQPNSNTTVNFKDQSLWVGINLAISFTDDFSAGVTGYYTSRDYSRTTTDQTTVLGNTKVSNETKVFTANNVIYEIGGLYKLNNFWKVGLSWRLPSIQLSGDGSYYRSTLDTSVSGIPTTVSQKNIQSLTHIPQKLAVGFSYENPKKFAIDFDTQFYGSDSYRDMPDPTAGDQVNFKQVTNFSVGAEYYLRSWLVIRGGAFTNLSSHPEIKDSNTRQTDHIDMYGFSSNIGIFTGATAFTFGGYYTGGAGQSTQTVNQQFIIVPKSLNIYSMLVATSFYF